MHPRLVQRSKKDLVRYTKTSEDSSMITFIAPLLFGFVLCMGTRTSCETKPTIIIGLYKLVLDFNAPATYLAVAKIALSNPYKSYTLLRNKDFRADVKRSIFEEKRSTEFALQELAKKYPAFAPLEDGLLRAIYSHTLNDAGKALIEDLKKAGITVIFATTAGPKALALHADKYPSFFTENTFVISENFEDYRGNTEYWKKALAKAPNASHTIAIEREEIHRKEAESLGITVIIAKNVAEIRQALENKGLLRKEL